MADTLGSLVDKLITVDMKMWNNQEILYDIRRMGLDEFRAKYFQNEDAVEELFVCLKKCCDLNVQRNSLIDEIDKLAVQMVKNPDDDNYVQNSHKTY